MNKVKELNAKTLKNYKSVINTTAQPHSIDESQTANFVDQDHELVRIYIEFNLILANKLSVVRFKLSVEKPI